MQSAHDVTLLSYAITPNHTDNFYMIDYTIATPVIIGLTFIDWSPLMSLTSVC